MTIRTSGAAKTQALPADDFKELVGGIEALYANKSVAKYFEAINLDAPNLASTSDVTFWYQKASYKLMDDLVESAKEIVDLNLKVSGFEALYKASELMCRSLEDQLQRETERADAAHDQLYELQLVQYDTALHAAATKLIDQLQRVQPSSQTGSINFWNTNATTFSREFIEDCLQDAIKVWVNSKL
jgi:hypothetical protein